MGRQEGRGGTAGGAGRGRGPESARDLRARPAEGQDAAQTGACPGRPRWQPWGRGPDGPFCKLQDPPEDPWSPLRPTHSDRALRSPEVGPGPDSAPLGGTVPSPLPPTDGLLARPSGPRCSCTRQTQKQMQQRSRAWCLVGMSRYCLIYFVSVSGEAQAQGERTGTEAWVRGERGREGQPGRRREVAGIESLALAPESPAASAESLRGKAVLVSETGTAPGAPRGLGRLSWLDGEACVGAGSAPTSRKGLEWRVRGSGAAGVCPSRVGSGLGVQPVLEQPRRAGSGGGRGGARVTSDTLWALP